MPSPFHQETYLREQVLFGRYNPSGKLAVTMYPPDFVK